MTKNSVIPFKNPDLLHDSLTELLRTGAKQLIHQFVEAELAELLESHQHKLTQEGKKAIVRKGYHPEREIQTGIALSPLLYPRYAVVKEKQ